MSPARAWCLIAAGGDRQYTGNTGYEDDPKSIYQYDSSVANHKQLCVGDFVLIRDKSRLLGVACVEEIETGSQLKSRQWSDG